MSILNDILPGNWFKKKDVSDNTQLKDKNHRKKGWFVAIQRFNDNVTHLVAFHSKLLIFIMLLFFVYLLFASVFQQETFSIRQFNVHSTVESNGYNNEFIAKKISYNITLLINEVPEKLFAMFARKKATERDDILYQRILGKYQKKEIKIDMDVNVGGINLPLQDFTKTARGLLNVEDKYLEGDITVENDLIIMTLGFNSNSINKNYETIRYTYNPDDTVRMIDIIDSLTLDAAKFILKQYDPLVTLLIDYNPEVVYSSSVDQWDENIYDEKERLSKLEEMYLDNPKDKDLAIWSHAIAGAFFSDEYEIHEHEADFFNALFHFEEAIEMDASFIDIVGFELAGIYLNNKDTTDAIRTYRKMIKSEPGNLQIHQQLLGIYSDQEDSIAYYKSLELAFENGLYIGDEHISRSHFQKYKDQERFMALLARYNDNNKPAYYYGSSSLIAQKKAKKAANYRVSKSNQGRPASKMFEKILSLNKVKMSRSRQVILVTNDHITSEDVKIEAFEEQHGRWVARFPETKGKIGYQGFAPYEKKREGDKKTPTGIYYLGPVYAADGERVKTRMEFWPATEDDYWIDDVNSPQYNRWVISNTDPKEDNVSREEMLRTQDSKYKYGISVQYNMDQIKGNGSVITVHVLEGQQPTVGCIAVPEFELLEIIDWLDPDKKPLIILGTADELVTTQVAEPNPDENDKYIWKREKYIPPVE